MWIAPCSFALSTAIAQPQTTWCPPGQQRFLLERSLPELHADLQMVSGTFPDIDMPLIPYGTKEEAVFLQVSRKGSLSAFRLNGNNLERVFTSNEPFDCKDKECRLWPEPKAAAPVEDAILQDGTGDVFRISGIPPTISRLGTIRAKLLGLVINPSSGEPLAEYAENEKMVDVSLSPFGTLRVRRNFPPTRYTPVQSNYMPDFFTRTLAILPGDTSHSFYSLVLRGGTTIADMGAQFQPPDLPWTENYRVVDFNGDGWSDIVSHAAPSRTLWAGVGSIDGYFEVPISGILPGTGVWKILGYGDINDDGLDDLLLYNAGANSWQLATSRSTEAVTRLVRDQTMPDAHGELCASGSSYGIGATVKAPGRSYRIVHRQHLRSGKIRVVLRGDDHAHQLFSLESIPESPYICTGYNTSYTVSDQSGNGGKWSARLFTCPGDHAFFFSGDNSYVAENEQAPGRACCPLPRLDILGERFETTDQGCSEGMILVGVIASGPRHYTWICRNIKERFLLGPERGGAYVGVGFSARSQHRRRRHDQLPPAIRTGALRSGMFSWDGDGCVGDPPGSVITSRTHTGQGCARTKFREILYSGIPGDPPKGTPVKMFPDCTRVDYPYRTTAKCIE